MKATTNFLQTSRTNKLIAAVVAVAVVATGYFVLRSGAAGFFAATELENGTLSGNAQIVSDSGASGGKAVRFFAGSSTTPPPAPPPTTPPPTTPPPTTPPPTPPPPTGTTTCPLPKYPKASCTGVPAGTSLSPHNGDFTTSSNNQVIEGRRITGDVEIRHSGVIIRNSEIYGEVKNDADAAPRFTVTDSTIGHPTSCSGQAAVGHTNYELTRVYIRGFNDGARIQNAHGSAKPGSVANVTIRDSYIKLCGVGPEAHSDGIQGYLAGGNATIHHNTIDQSSVPKEEWTAPIFWSDSSGNNLVFTDNMLKGGGYTIRIHAGSGHTVTGNKVVNNSWNYGAVDSSCSVINWNNNSIVDIDSNYNITRTVNSLACSG